jgi:group II intron reverse transcriptase/maturase
LSFVLADSPDGGGSEWPPDASEGRAFLLQRAKRKRSARTVAWAGDTSRLLEEVASEANLALALINVLRNRGAPVLDGQTVEEAEAQAPKPLPRLRRALLKGCYRPGDVPRVFIPKPGGGQRGLGIPNVIDRVARQAVLQVLEPVFEPTIHPSSHGFRPRRGAMTAIAEAKEHLKAGYRTVVDLDLAQFFDRVHHQRLLDPYRSAGGGSSGGRLVRLMLKAAAVMPDGTRIIVREGTPQGGPLSPLLSNIVLDELDWELTRRGHRLVRYADDCNVFVGGARAGARVMASTTKFPERRMRLQVNAAKSAVRHPSKAHFLGFRFLLRQDGEIGILLWAKTERRLAATIRQMTPSNWGRSITACMDGLSRYLTGWMAHYRLCSADAIKGSGVIDAHIRRRIRAIIVRQKKRPRFLLRHLLALGVGRSAAAGAAYCGRGAWHRSNRPALTRAYRRPGSSDDWPRSRRAGKSSTPHRHRTSSRWRCDRSTQRAGCGPASPVL